MSSLSNRVVNRRFCWVFFKLSLLFSREGRGEGSSFLPWPIVGEDVLFYLYCCQKNLDLSFRKKKKGNDVM